MSRADRTLPLLKLELERRLIHSLSDEIGPAIIAIEDLGTSLVCDFATGHVSVERNLNLPTLATSTTTLLGLLYGGSNLGSVLRRGDLRMCDAAEAAPVVADAVLTLLAFDSNDPVLSDSK
jgi:hypothetical protein